jgi:hypothetical protein
LIHIAFFTEHRPMTSGAITRIWPLRAGVAAIALAAVTVITISACIIGATAAASATAARRQSGFGAAARVAVAHAAEKLVPGQPTADASQKGQAAK